MLYMRMRVLKPEGYVSRCVLADVSQNIIMMNVMMNTHHLYKRKLVRYECHTQCHTECQTNV